MTEEELGTATENQSVHAQLLNGYDGSYSLGVIRTDGRLALLLRVEGDPPTNIPKSIVINGEQITVVVKGEFKGPQPLSETAR